MENETKLFGIRAVLEAIENKQTLDKVWVINESKGELMRQLLKSLDQNGIPFAWVPAEKFFKYQNKNHQGVMAQIAPVSFVSIETLVENALESSDQHPLFIILDRVSDARNFGAILRTAACLNVNGIIIPNEGSAGVNADTIKTSAGGVFHVPICKVDHLKDAFFYLQGSGIHIVAATEKADNLIYNAHLNKPLAVLMGSEDKGINPSLLKMVDEKAKLPMIGKISSLNVSVACGAILYEIWRQRSI
jgi:23S rRNA (guanosine2251-2'-O)-methyltransferase